MEWGVCRLVVIHEEIAGLKQESVRVEKEMWVFRHCQRDERHAAWDAELVRIKERIAELVKQKKLILTAAKREHEH